MSTLSSNTSGKRLAKLAAAQQVLFHTDDLALMFDIHNENTLRVTLSRYGKEGILHRIKRGLYSIIPPEKIHPHILGAACLHRFCYLGAESVLRNDGYILQSMDAITFFSDVSRRFSMLEHRFVVRQLSDRFLHNQTGIKETDGIFVASPERAIADLLYIDPWYHFDRPIDWKKIFTMQREIGYPPTPHRYVDSTHQ